jgi:hypothetical protein
MACLWRFLTGDRPTAATASGWRDGAQFAGAWTRPKPKMLSRLPASPALNFTMAIRASISSLRLKVRRLWPPAVFIGVAS